MLLTVMIKLFGFYFECRLVIGTPVGAVRPGPDPFPGRTNYQFSFLCSSLSVMASFGLLAHVFLICVVSVRSSFFRIARCVFGWE